MDLKSIRLERRQINAAEDMVDREQADDASDAIRQFVNSGMAEYGYRGGQNTETTLKTYSHRLAWAFAIIGVTWMATTLFAPVVLRIPAFAAMSSSLGMLGLHRFLDEHEPAITNRLRSLTGGEPA